MRRDARGLAVGLVAVAVLLVGLAAVPTATAATTVSGTVTVENGTADGAAVTVVPVTGTLERAGESARTTVAGDSFSASVTDAPRYAVRVEYGGATHHSLLRNRTRAEIHLSERIDGRVVDATGTPRSGVSIGLVDGDGFVVSTAETDANGTVAFGPVEADESYRLRATVDGAPYRRSVDPTATGTATLSIRPPTTDASVLRVPEGARTGYVVQLVAPRNASGAPSAIETVTLRNGAGRPFVGTVDLRVPANATPYAAMVGGRETAYERTDAGVRLNVTVPANGTVRVGVASDLAGPRVETTLGRDAPRVAVVLRGYDPSAVDHSSNLRVGEAPVALLTSDGPLPAGERLRIDLSEARTAGTATNASAGGATGAGPGSGTGTTSDGAPPSASNSIPSFPGVPILGAVAGTVAAGFAVSRFGRRGGGDDAEEGS